MRTAAAYLSLLQALLPKGRAWVRSPTAVMTATLSALSEELARADQRGLDLVEEADPRTTVEMLPDWERLVGIPDGCTPVAASIEDRQIAVYQRIATLGGQSRAYFIALAERLGYTAEIIEFRPARLGDHLGDFLYGEAWAHAWMLMTVQDLEDDPRGLMCLVRRAAPAHTTVLFGSQEGPSFFFDFLGG